MKCFHLFLLLESIFCSHVACAQDKPAHQIDLNHWKLTLPVDAFGGSAKTAVEISAQQLAAGYNHPDYFRMDARGEMQFWCPVTGATTEGTEYPRSELREVIDPTDDNVNWFPQGTHLLAARCRVTEIPSSQKVIVGQIHSFSGKARPLVKLQLFKSRIEALVKVSPESGQDRKLVFPDVGLNKDFDFQIKLQDGVLSVTVNDVTQTENIFQNGPDWAKETFYFKAGAYCQDNGGPSSEGARVVFSRLKATHLHPH